MIYNTIMVQLDIDLPAAPRLAFAWNLAQRFEALGDASGHRIPP